MPLTDQDIRALVHLAVACRPLGAPRWDEAGIFAAIAKVRTLAIDDVCLATIRAAADAGAKTPGVIANTQAPNWSERAPNRPQPFTPYDPSSFCSVCNKPEGTCRRNELSGHEFTSAVDHVRRLSHDTHKPPLRDLASGATTSPGGLT
jgi:hypothetical protein